MKYYLFLLSTLWIALPVIGQVPYNSSAPNGYTKKAMVSEQVGLSQVTITYHRPAVNKRSGKIWGGVVHKGFKDLGFGKGLPAPWRAGANENTIIEFDSDVKVEGQPLQKGKYGLFIAFDSVESLVIFSRRSDAWGSFFYDPAEDVIRVKVKPRPVDKNIEFLKFEFSEQTQNSALVALSWEQLSIPFRVEVDYLKQQFEAFVTESQNPQGFTSQGLTIAANWCLQNNYQLEKALEWATLATRAGFPGDPASFNALTTKAWILHKLKKPDEATAIIKQALPFGTMGQLQQMGRQLITLKKPETALEVFQYNYTKHPDQFITLTGLARGLSANGQYAAALGYASKAASLAPDEPAKKTLQLMIDKLKTGKDINE